VPRSGGSRYLNTPCWSAVFFVPVARQSTLVGYLWASVRDDAAGFVCCRRGAATLGLDMGQLIEHWHGRLRTSALAGLAPIATLQDVTGGPQDPAYGGVAATARPQRARTLHRLHDRANPGTEYDGPVRPATDAEPSARGE
jgi:hypothetical protein